MTLRMYLVTVQSMSTIVILPMHVACSGIGRMQKKAPSSRVLQELRDSQDGNVSSSPILVCQILRELQFGSLRLQI